MDVTTLIDKGWEKNRPLARAKAREAQAEYLARINRDYSRVKTLDRIFFANPA